ncbi:hypothetical protein BH24CHL5_BH24CHL5_11880 [soil metagenome]
MTPETANLVFVIALAVSLGVIALSALIAAIAVWRMGRHVGRVTRSLDDVALVVSTELPPAMRELRQTAVNLARLSDELSPRLERVDGLLDEADASVQALRAAAEAAEDIVRGPAAAVERARRTVSAAGKGFARGADRLRRSVEDRAGRP